MAEKTKIAWCDHTFNPWTGRTKVSPGCANCYAEKFAKRNSKIFGGWGKGAKRIRTSATYWKQPLKWNREAERTGIRPRVFCASLSDWLDDEVNDAWFTALMDLIRRTQNLDWLLLTKRLENWKKRISRALDIATACNDIDVSEFCSQWLNGTPPANVWIGTTVENQEMADKRIPELLNIPAKVRFLSCEPLLGEIRIQKNFLAWNGTDYYSHPYDCTVVQKDGIHWVICGGESGSHARPMHPDWARSLHDQCKAAGVPFFMKQIGGARKPFPEIPENLMIREFPRIQNSTTEGKKMSDHPQMTPVEAALGFADTRKCPNANASVEMLRELSFGTNGEYLLMPDVEALCILAGEVRRLHEELYSIASTTEVPDATAESITGEFKRKKIELESAHSENKRLRALVPQWQPIETAPKDGTQILLVLKLPNGQMGITCGTWLSSEKLEITNAENDTDLTEGFYEESLASDDINIWPISPILWQPLPAAPESEVAI